MAKRIMGKSDRNQACDGWVRAVLPYGMEHHVYFWLKEEFQNEQDRKTFEEGLSSLFEIKDLVAGGRWAVPAPVVVRPVIDQSWDYALTMQFDSVEKHDIYQEDPDHHVFITTFKDWWAQVQVRDLA